MKTTQLKAVNAIAAALAGASFIAASPTQACNAETATLADVCTTAATFCPRGYTEADGRLLPISDNQALYSLIGTAYGGDGRSTFALPDLRGRTAVGLGQGLGLGTDVLLGQKRGAETTTLTVANLPSHNHLTHAVDADGVSAAAVNTWPANPVGDVRGAPVDSAAYSPGGTAVTLNSDVIGYTGSNLPSNNLPPQLGIRYCIATTGLYPSRN